MGNRICRFQPLAAALALFFIVPAACDKSRKPTRSTSPTPTTPANAACDQATTTHGAGPLTWFHDDYEQARACATELGRPLVIDMWALWCHTCLSMKHYVLVDPSLATYADRFVWLAVDTDRDENAPLLAKFPVTSWPTFFIVAAEDESLQGRFVGSSSVTQFREFLSSGERAYIGARAGSLAADSPLALARRGDQAATRGELAAADAAYGAALATAPRDWPRRPDVLVSRIGVRYRQKAWPECVALGAAAMEQTGSSASAIDFAFYAFMCAGKSEDAAAARALGDAAAARIEAVVADDKAPLSIDDRSDGLRVLREIREAAGDAAGGREHAERQRGLLDRAAAAAPSPLAAMTYNWPRAEVYVYLDRAAELVPVLVQSVADLPAEYDPPYRLSWLYLNLEDHDNALAMAERARALVYGPRAARVYNLIAEIHAARGDRSSERRAREQVIAIYEGLPAGQRQAEALEQARAALLELAEDDSVTP